MAEASARARTNVVFELDRFERVGQDRLEIEGRWSGVRGRRFMRPSLSVATNGSSQRLLAELEHKPWEAEASGLWRAAFVTDGIEDLSLVAPELAVAPDISIVLPPPSGGQGRELQIVADGRPNEDEAGSPLLNHGSQPRPRAQPRRPRATADGELSAAVTAARSAQATAEAREAQTREQATQAQAQLREQLEAAQADLRRLGAERDRLVSQHYAAVSERDGARAERDSAQARQAAAEAQRDSALAERAGMRAARDVAERGQAAALAQRDEAAEARDAALGERDAARAPAHEPPADPAGTPSVMREEIARLRRERDALLRERDALLGERTARPAQRSAPLSGHEPVDRASAMLSRHPINDPAQSPDAGWARRIAAVAFLLACLIALAIITHVL